jgi:iron complex outermembrane recepter protein
VSKASRKLRREAVSANKSRATELSILAIGATFLAPYAIAQDAAATNTAESAPKAEEDLTEILVTGIRKALATSQEIKKEADTVVDSITASDIGAFPDKSVAEALQRMSGITVTRFAASGDTTHFSAEPSGVVIRGLPQVRSEFNGRDSFNANSSRGLSFADVSPELMAGVDTYKNATADMIEGGIAGTVNLRTHVPFDSEGFVAAFSGELGYGDLSEEAKPSGSALFSNRWDTGAGEIGIMVNAAYSSVTTESQGLQLNRFFNVQGVADYGGGQKWFPGGVDIRNNTYERERTGGSIAAQWKSPGETLHLLLQYNRSEYQNDWEEYSLNAGIGNSQTAQDLVLTSPLGYQPAGAAPYEFDSRGVFMRGTIADSVNSWVGPNNNSQLAHPNGYETNLPGDPSPGTFLNWFCYSWSVTSNATCPSTRGIGLSADTRFSTSTNVTEDLSANFRWDVSERVGLLFDVQKIDATVENFDNSMNSKTATDLYLDFTGNKPKFQFNLPSGYGMTAGGFSDPRNWYHEWTMEHAEDSEGNEMAYRLDADIDLDAGWLDSLRIGVRRAEREQNINWSTYNWGSVNPLWGVQGDQPFFLTQGPWTDTFAAHDLGPDQLGGGVYGGGVMIHPNFGLVSDYQATIDKFGNGASNSWVNLGSRTSPNFCTPTPGALYCPVEQQRVQEDVDAAYVMLKFGGDDTKIGNVSVRGNIGARFVKTTVEAIGGGAFPTYIPPTPPPPPSPGQPVVVDVLTLVPADDRAFMNGGTFADTSGGEHTNVLPSLNLRFGLTDEQFFRFAISRALARPDMGLYKNYIGVSRAAPGCGDGSVTYEDPNDCTSNPIAYTPQYTASAGNPALESTTADQIDLTYEWYFSNTGSFTTALFYKKFNDYIQVGSYTRDFTNNGVTRTVTVEGPITGDGASLKGFEIAYQQFLDMLPEPWNGIGFQTNFTYVDNKGVSNANLSSVSGGGSTRQDPLITFTNLPLEGFSKSSYNIVLMFEKSKYSARLAWNWRDDYLISQSDCCIKLPIWQDAYGQLDGSVHFKPSDSWDIFFDAQNILQAETVLRQQVTNEGLLLPRSWFVNDRRLQIGVRYRIQ